MIAVIVLLQCPASATAVATETKPERMNVPLLTTTRASTVQGGRPVALHAFYNSDFAGYFLAFKKTIFKKNKHASVFTHPPKCFKAPAHNFPST